MVDFEGKDRVNRGCFRVRVSVCVGCFRVTVSVYVGCFRVRVCVVRVF